MPLDDLVLAAQRAVDRLVRWLRHGPPPVQAHRRLLIVQIDGLSRDVLEHALASGRMPFLRRRLRSGSHRLEPMSVGLPTSTPAFQLAAMYGVHPDIPGFHYYDRGIAGDIHFPRPGHAAFVEEQQAAGRAGIVQGGSAYGCVFAGGADNHLFTLHTMTRPSGRGVLPVVSAFVVLGWVVVKCLARTILELLRAVLRFVADPVGGVRGWRWRTMKLGLSHWVRELFTLAASRDLYAGAPTVYVNYLDYDVVAHAFGPRSRRALASLRRVDRALRQLWRVTRRVPEHRYDVYVLADHGQAPSTPYHDLSGGRHLERWIFERFLGGAGPEPSAPGRGLARGIRASRLGTVGLVQRFLHYLDEDFLRRGDPEAWERDGIRVISAGPNAFLYVLDAPGPLDVDALDERLPGLAEELSRSPGVGFVLARSGSGPVCFWRGKRFVLGPGDPGPFAGRVDTALVVQGITELMSMANAGDLVIYGTDAPEGHVSYIAEKGAHAGHSPAEMQTFVVHPARVTLPSPLTHPVQLYDHFIRSQGRHPDARR